MNKPKTDLVKKLVFPVITAALMFACGSEESSTSNEQNQENKDSSSSNQTETLVFDQNDYVNDWIEIRESILAADTSTLEKYFETNDTDAPSLINMCSEDWVKDELKELPYSSLSDVDYNGDLVKEFSAEIIEQYEGEEFGSAIYIYLKETKTGLRITGIMAAG